MWMTCDLPDIPISPYKKLLNQISPNLFKMVIFHNFLAITPVWNVIETWDFCVDDPCDFPDIPISPQKNVPNQTSHTKYLKWS